jgi:signal transduction histidine kinase
MARSIPVRSEADSATAFKRWVPPALLALSFVLLFLATLPGLGGSPGWGTVSIFPVTIGFGVVGALVATRTSSRVGWLFLAEALILAMSVFSNGYAGKIRPTLPGAPWVGWMFTVVLAMTFTPLLLALLLFPDGELPSRRWRPVVWATIAAGLVATLTCALAPVNFSNNFSHLKDPVTILPASAMRGVFNAALGAQVPTLFLICAGSLIVRLVRARGDQRLQLKWFVFATAVAAVVIGVAAVRLPDPGQAFSLFAPLIPIAAGVAIFKYHLYDIDVVINKTVVLGALAAFITVVYVAIVVGAGAVIGHGSSPNVGLSIVATAVVAVAFQPVRDRVQRFANRLVYGDRATPYEVLSEFSSRMADGYESDDLLPRMARILGEGAGAQSAQVWVRVDDELRTASTWPPSEDSQALAMTDGAIPPVPDASLVLPVAHRGELLGALSLTKPPGERLTPTEEKLAGDLASGAGLVLRNVRLTEELLARLEDLRASRQRLVAAQDAERRRLERNIHDGAQQQLVALAIKVRLAQRFTGQDPAKANQLLEQIESEVKGALEDLRDLARGIYPPLLADQGLVVALRAQAQKSPLPVDVEGESIPRYPQEAEACVYFCVLEALQNTSKYSDAQHVSVRLVEAGEWLEFSVVDDGVGFDPSARGYGTGLQGMGDRLAALGGDLQVESAPGRGTTVSGRLPIKPVAELLPTALG